ncbi:replicative DNA helicase [Helicobacter sp. MIT 05-5293]|uniref:replicative DNA helicase n=1 Tax=Helicobacter sp. MIT 05-5293 TaxID=1548149 RepID=UPI00051DD74C|nr:replicative DNA helicase [Helicobacter sp. MIT 05-5293]TLD80541.1 replicative DNA helicase [Helicobacter sp. MIT 05-5293]
MQEHIINIERVVISSIIFSPEIFESVSSELTSHDFIYALHRDIFETCLYLHHSGLPIDSDLIMQKMPKEKQITQEEMVGILATNPIANIEAYVSEIKEASMKRDLHSLANLLREKSMDSTHSVETLIEDIEKKVYEISLGKAQGEFQDAKMMVNNALDFLKDLKNRGNQIVVGLDTGFRELNKCTTGFNKGDLIIIGARPSMGKTTLVLNIAQHLLNKRCGVAIFSLEMPAVQLILRMMSAQSSIALQNLRVGNLTDSEWSKLTEVADKMAGSSFFVEDGSLLTISQLRSKLRKLKSKHPEVNIAIIDYLQLMAGAKSENKQHEISDISRGLKTLARELEMPIIALSQLNRLVEARDDKRPILSDLRDSGAIEQDADVILFLYRDDVYKKRADRERYARLKKEGKEKDFKPEHQEREVEPAELIVAKNRNGETRTIEIRFNKRFTRFEDMPQEISHEMNETRIDGEVFMQQLEQRAPDMPDIF